MLLRYFLPIYLLVYFAVAFFWRSYLLWRRTGVNPYVLGNSDSAHDFIGRWLRITAVSSVLVVLSYSSGDRWYQFLTPIPWLEYPIITAVGVLLLLLSLGWIVLAQAQMGASWRIGIDTQRPTELVQQGLFRLTRNPIFLGMRVNLLGFFLTLPNALTFAILLVGDILMQIQVRLEEEHLARLHGASYQVYRQQTRRWL